MKNKFSSLVLLLSFFFGLFSMNAQEDVWYHFQEGFPSLEIDGWVFSSVASSGFDNGLYEGTNALKMKNSYVQMPSLTSSLQFSFWYRTGNKGVEDGNIYALKSTDEGQTWDTLNAIVNVTETMTTYQEVVCDIDELNACILRIETSYTDGFWVIDDIAVTKEAPQIAADNVEITSISASCKTVSSEEVEFVEDVPGVFVAEDSIGFDAECTLSCTPFSPYATVEQIKGAYPMPGANDTAIFVVTAQDQVTTATYKVIIAKSLYQTKFGFVPAIDQNISSYDGWSFAGRRYPSASKGNGGAYPGENIMRIYNKDGDVGYFTSPQYSSISTLSFVAKFSKADGTEGFVVQTSTDGVNFEDFKTYVTGGDIPSYTTESADDPFSAVQTLELNMEDVYVRFLVLETNSSDVRIGIDDVAIRATYDYTPTYSVEFSVVDFDKNPLESATITIDSQDYTTDVNGRVYLTDLTPGEMNYSVAYNDFIEKSGKVIINGAIQEDVILLDEELEIFVALGQSNMAGRADIGDYTASIDGAYLLDYDGAWVAAQNPMNMYSNIRKDLEDQKLGPSYSFAQTMAKYLDKRVCMIVNARGGTSLSKFSEGGIYNEAMMSRIKEANAYGDVKAVIWHQGESGSSSYSTYLSRLNELVVDIREATDDNFFFVAGQLGPWYDKYKGFNDNLVNISSEVSNSNYVVNDSLWHRGDSTHFNTISQIVLGQRYAQSVLHNVYDLDIAVFNLVLDGAFSVTCGDDVMTTSGSFTPLWSDDAVLEIKADGEASFASLSINGIEISEAVGASTYNYTPTTDNQKLTITATMGLESALDNTSAESLAFYPNPTSGTITFSGGDDLYHVCLYDLAGRQVHYQECRSSLDISSLKGGCYLLQIQSGEDVLVDRVILN